MDFCINFMASLDIKRDSNINKQIFIVYARAVFDFQLSYFTRDKFEFSNGLNNITPCAK